MKCWLLVGLGALFFLSSTFYWFQDARNSFTPASESVVVSLSNTPSTTVSEIRATTSASQPAVSTTTVSMESLSSVVPAGGISVDLSALSVEQKAVAGTLGFTDDAVTISPEVIACVESAFGLERLTAIIDGETPTILEGISAIACFNQPAR